MALVLAFMHLYSIFKLRLLLTILCLRNFKIGYWNAIPKWSIVPASPNYFAIFIVWEQYRRDYLLDYVWMFCVDIMCMFCKSPEVTQCGWRGYKPSINKRPLTHSVPSTRILYVPARLSYTPVPKDAERHWDVNLILFSYTSEKRSPTYCFFVNRLF